MNRAQYSDRAVELCDRQKLTESASEQHPSVCRIAGAPSSLVLKLFHRKNSDFSLFTLLLMRAESESVASMSLRGREFEQRKVAMLPLVSVGLFTTRA